MTTLTAERLLDLRFAVSNCLKHESIFESSESLGDAIQFNSGVSGEATLSTECGVQLQFGWHAEGGKESYLDAFEFEIGPFPNNPGFELTGATLVNDDGDELSDWECEPVFLEILKYSNWKNSVSGLLPEPETFDLDFTEDSEMETFEIARDNDRPIRFSGELIASATSSDNNAHHNYSGSTGRWTTLELYRTKGGKYICSQVGHTRWEKERTRYSAAICSTEEEVFKFLGHGWLAKRLYDNADLDSSITVD